MNETVNESIELSALSLSLSVYIWIIKCKHHLKIVKNRIFIYSQNSQIKHVTVYNFKRNRSNTQMKLKKQKPKKHSQYFWFKRELKHFFFLLSNKQTTASAKLKRIEIKLVLALYGFRLNIHSFGFI